MPAAHWDCLGSCYRFHSKIVLQREHFNHIPIQIFHLVLDYFRDSVFS